MEFGIGRNLGDYNALLANMIAQARPRQAPGGGGARLMGGGGGGGIQQFMSRTQEPDTSVGVDVGGIIRTGEDLGLWQTPKTKRDLAAQGRDLVEGRMDPNSREQYYANPDVQKQLEKFGKAGSQHVWFDTGAQRWAFVPMSEDERRVTVMGKPSAPGPIAAGMYNVPGTDYGKTYAENMQATNPPTMYSILSKTPEAPGLITQGYKADIAHKQSEAERNRQAVEESKALVGPRGAEMTATAQWKKAEAELALARKKGIKTPEDEQKMRMLENELNNYKTTEHDMHQNILFQTDEGIRDQMLQNYGASVIRHIDTVASLDKGDPRWASGAAAGYMSHISNDVSKIQPGKTSSQQALRLNRYLGSIDEVRKRFGSVIDPNLQGLMVDNVTNIIGRLPSVTPDQVKYIEKWLISAVDMGNVKEARRMINMLQQRMPQVIPQMEKDTGFQLRPLGQAKTPVKPAPRDWGSAVKPGPSLEEVGEASSRAFE